MSATANTPSSRPHDPRLPLEVLLAALQSEPVGRDIKLPPAQAIPRVKKWVREHLGHLPDEAQADALAALDCLWGLDLSRDRGGGVPRRSDGEVAELLYAAIVGDAGLAPNALLNTDLSPEIRALIAEGDANAHAAAEAAEAAWRDYSLLREVAKSAGGYALALVLALLPPPAI